MEDKKRCPWCLGYEPMVEYHDKEWGTPLHSDRKHFEFISLEVMQCGLNWLMMMKKREIFKECFDDFDYEKIALYGEEKIEEILNTPGMIRSRRKVEAIINNANRFLEVIEEVGSFDDYIWGFSGHRSVIYRSGNYVTSKLSDDVSRDLKKRGFKYLGSVTVYAHLEACGIVNDHSEACFRYAELAKDCVVMDSYPAE